MLTEKDYKALAVLSARLAESVLMDWNKEEQVRLAKVVATKCLSIFNDKENRDFVSLVKRMREAQEEWESQPSFKWGDTDLFNTLRKLESEVDEYLKKMEE